MKTFFQFLVTLAVITSLSNLRVQAAFRFHLGHQDGLCGNYIRDIGEDGHGFVWVATSNGLNRFDGMRFSKFTKENSGLNSNELNSVLADPSDPDLLWISTRHDGICRYDYRTGQITPLSTQIKSPDIPQLSLSSDNKIWITHYHFPPEKFDPATGNITPLFDDIPSDFPRPVWCVAEDPTGRFLYIGHENNGLSVVNLKTMEFRNFRHDKNDPASICGNTVYSICIDDRGLVWTGTENGLSIFNPTTQNFISSFHTADPHSLLEGAVRSIRLMTDGDLCIATSRGGVSILRRKDRLADNFIFDNRTPSTDNPLDQTLYSSSAYVIFEDSYGNRWIGFRSDGIDVLGHEDPFFRMSEFFGRGKMSHGSPAVWSMATDSNNNVWTAGDKEITIISDNFSEHYRLPSAPAGLASQVRTLLHANGMLWVGTENAGAYRFNPADASFTPVTGIDREVRAFLLLDDGSIAAGTHDGIFSIGNDCTATPHERLNKAIPDRYIISMIRDKKGNVIVGTFNLGVAVINHEGSPIKIINNESGLPSNTVNDILEDSKGNIWIATRDGVACLEPDGYTISQTPALPKGDSSNVKAMEEDSYGRIWMSSEDGISVFNPASGNVSSYSNSHMGPLTAFLEGSSCVTDKGRILFGSLNGLLSFDPYAPTEFHSKGEIRVNTFLVHDRDNSGQNIEISIPVNSDHITLPHNLNTFTIRFNNPDISAAANSEIIYNMKGINDIWSSSGASHEADYRNLRPGTYEFQVCHRFNGGEWSKPERLLTITITPPIYLTWWAKTIYILLTVAAIAAIAWSYRKKLNLEKNLTIERENSKNNHLLNEERLMFYTNITHELRTPLSLIIGPIEDLMNNPDLNAEHRKKLFMIRSSSMRLLNLINSILEFRKTESRNRKLEVRFGNFSNFVREIGLRFKELNNNKNVDVILKVNDLDTPGMYFDPEMMTTVLNNLIGNALKYTKEGHVVISLTQRNEGGVAYADIRVADTGEGITADELPNIFKRYYQAHHNRKIAGTGIGLALVKSLVELHEGKITVESEKGVGSTFTVSLIIGNTYPDAIHRDITNDSSGETEENTRNNDNPRPELTVLVVEDDDDVREYISDSLSACFNVVCARDGAEGVEAMRTTIPDIVVSDIMMQKMDGIELCRKIKENVATSHIPVILLTAKDSIPDKEEGYRSGADSYLTKPFSAQLLISRINNILETRRRLSLMYLSEPSDENTMESHMDAVDQTDPAEREEGDRQTTISPLDLKFISRLRELVEQNIEMEDIDIPFLTDKMCMSHSTLYRKVKSITGLTPNEFIRKIRLTKAMGLLKKGDVPISEIPFLTGFSSLSYFRKVFKKEFGMTPTEFMRSIFPKTGSLSQVMILEDEMGNNPEDESKAIAEEQEQDAD